MTKINRDVLTNLPAVSDLDNVMDARVVLYQSGQLVHMPLLGLANLLLAAAEGSFLLLEGDQQVTGFDGILLEGDAQISGNDKLILE